MNSLSDRVNIILQIYYFTLQRYIDKYIIMGHDAP